MKNKSLVKDCSGIEGVPKEFFSPNEIADLVQYLNELGDEKIRIGAGLSGVSGGAVPNENEVFIDLRNLKNIAWVDESAGVFEVECGVLISDLIKFVEAADWCFPIVPGSLNIATIGGFVACNGGGGFSLKYGKIGKYVLGLDVISASGEINFFGSYVTKNSEFPPMEQLFIGSEGRLGIISKILFRCIPKKSKVYHYRISHQNLDQLLQLQLKLVKLGAILLEIAERDALKFSSNVDENVIWVVFEEQKEIKLSKDFNIIEGDETLLEERFKIGHSIQKYKKFIDVDFSIPLKNTLLVVLEIKKILHSFSLEHVFFGHGGDGNWHLHIFENNDIINIEKAIVEIDVIIRKNNGNISGEHGIGRIHKKRFQDIISPNLLLLKSIKKYLDPKTQFPELI